LCLVSEYDGVELGKGCDTAIVAHLALGRCIDGMEDKEFGNAGASYHASANAHFRRLVNLVYLHRSVEQLSTLSQ
jgi:hypothetical protein